MAAEDKNEKELDLDSRLDELFGDDDDEPDAGSVMEMESTADEETEVLNPDLPEGEETPSSKLDLKGSKLEQLESLVLNMDWEITDDVLDEYIAEVKRLENDYQADKILYSFLKMQSSVGNYIRVKKAKANPDAIKLVQSVFAEFARVYTDTQLSEADKKAILMSEVRKFHDLKSKIKPAGSPAVKKSPQGFDLDQILEKIRQDIKETIRSEFAALKAKLDGK